MFAGHKLRRRAGGIELDFVYLGKNTNTANSTSYTFSSVSIGAAHPERMVVIGISGYGATNNNITGVTIGGTAVDYLLVKQGLNNTSAVCYLKKPTGTTANIVVTFAGSSQGCVISRYRFNTANTSHVDAEVARDTSNVEIDNLAIEDGGVAIWHITGQSVFTSVTWTGADSVVTDSTTAPESNDVKNGHILCTETTTTDDFVGSGGSLPTGVAISFGI